MQHLKSSQCQLFPGFSYASVAMVTDYDCWKDSEEAVDVAKVMEVLDRNVNNLRKLFVQTIKLLGENNWTDVIKQNQVRYVMLGSMSNMSS